VVPGTRRGAVSEAREGQIEQAGGVQHAIDETVELKGQDIFAVGTWNGIEFTDDDVDSIVRSFELLGLSGHVPLKLGHEGPDARDEPESQFALGWVKRVYREGKKLLADMDVPAKVAKWIREGMLRYVSVELLRDVKADTREIPWVLDAVALLGSDQPAVGILKSLTLSKARSAALQFRARAVFTRDNHQSGDRPTMADPTVSELMARLDKLEAEKKALETKAAEGESFQRKLTELQQQTHAEKVTAHRAKLMEAFEAPIKEKKILPAVREQFKRMYKVDTDDVLSATVADAEVFMKAHPNPDYRPNPASLGGIDPNDPADKAKFSAEQAASAAFASQQHLPPNQRKSRDQLLVEAYQAEFRRNPDLAKAWQSAPGQIGA
jgi:hypothetical protein